MENKSSATKIWVKRQCAIKNCESCAGSGVSMGRFPKRETELLKWLEITKLKTVSEQTLICGLHFKRSDFKNLSACRRTLKNGAVPSMYLHDEDNSEHICYETDFEEVSNTIDVHSASESICEMNYQTEDILKNDSDQEKLDNLINEDHAEFILSIKKRLSNSEENCLMFTDEAVQKECNLISETADKSIQTLCGVSSEVANNQVLYTERKMQYLMGLIKTDNDLRCFTGINHKILKGLIKSINLLQDIQHSKKSFCTLEERIVLTLFKLKLCLSFQCLVVLFGISHITARSYFIESIHLLSAVLEEVVYFPEKIEILGNIPTYFKNFKDTRIVLDCTEIPVEISNCLQCRLKIYSHYKGKQTLKFLIGVTPSGMISYFSKAYGGRASDKAIFLQSELLNKLTTSKDAVMTDKGFLIESECATNNTKLYRPPFSQHIQQISREDALKTKEVAAARVHVERTIARLKMFFILKTTIKWNMTKYVDTIMMILCDLVNLSSPVIDNKHFINQV